MPSITCDGFLLQARLGATLPGLARDLGQDLIEAAHRIRTCSKMSCGNIDVRITLA